MQNDSSPALKPSRRTRVAGRMTGPREKITWWFARQDSQEDPNAVALSPEDSSHPSCLSPEIIPATPADKFQPRIKRKKTWKQKKERLTSPHPSCQHSSSCTPPTAIPAAPFSIPTSRPKKARRKPLLQIKSCPSQKTKTTASLTEVAAVSTSSDKHARQEEEKIMGKKSTLD